MDQTAKYLIFFIVGAVIATGASIATYENLTAGNYTNPQTTANTANIDHAIERLDKIDAAINELVDLNQQRRAEINTLKQNVTELYLYSDTDSALIGSLSNEVSDFRLDLSKWKGSFGDTIAPQNNSPPPNKPFNLIVLYDSRDGFVTLRGDADEKDGNLTVRVTGSLATFERTTGINENKNNFAVQFVPSNLGVSDEKVEFLVRQGTQVEILEYVLP